MTGKNRQSKRAGNSGKSRTYNKVFAKVIDSLPGIVHEGISKPLHPVVDVLGHCLPRHAIKQRQDRLQMVQLTTQLPACQFALIQHFPWIQSVDTVLIVAMMTQSGAWQVACTSCQKLKCKAVILVWIATVLDTIKCMVAGLQQLRYKAIALIAQAFFRSGAGNRTLELSAEWWHNRPVCTMRLTCDYCSEETQFHVAQYTGYQLLSTTPAHIPKMKR